MHNKPPVRCHTGTNAGSMLGQHWPSIEPAWVPDAHAEVREALHFYTSHTKLPSWACWSCMVVLGVNVVTTGV